MIKLFFVRYDHFIFQIIFLHNQKLCETHQISANKRQDDLTHLTASIYKNDSTKVEYRRLLKKIII